jgi:hypothetical protein
MKYVQELKYNQIERLVYSNLNAFDGVGDIKDPCRDIQVDAC